MQVHAKTIGRHVTSQEFAILCDLGFANFVNLAFDFLLVSSRSLRVFLVIDLHSIHVLLHFFFLLLFFLLYLLYFWGTTPWSRGSLTGRSLGPRWTIPAHILRVRVLFLNCL